MMRTVSIFGATGSVGRSTIDLIARNPDDFRILALAGNNDVDGLAQMARDVGAQVAVTANPANYGVLKAALVGSGVEAAAGEQALIDAAQMGADWTMASIVGCAGLKPTMAALKTGRTVALANKESLVSAGGLMMDAARRSGATLLPVDSEHNAIFQCLAGSNLDDVARITLTASGGPFRTCTRAEMAAMTPAQAVAHPNWSMGAKISVDSATMMNKGLELIEACWLFDARPSQVEVVVHPQSVIHSLVDYVDGSVLAQLGNPDMRTPIANALAWPERIDSGVAPLDLFAIARLDFQAPDEQRFPCLRLARQAAEAGNSAPAMLNAANEVAVSAFLERRIRYPEIASIIDEVLTREPVVAVNELDAVFAADARARVLAQQWLQRNGR